MLLFSSIFCLNDSLWYFECIYTSLWIDPFHYLNLKSLLGHCKLTAQTLHVLYCSICVYIGTAGAKKITVWVTVAPNLCWNCRVYRKTIYEGWWLLQEKGNEEIPRTQRRYNLMILMHCASWGCNWLRGNTENNLREFDSTNLFLQ